MPIYDIYCDDCEAASEVLVLGSAEELVCSICGGTNTRKLVAKISSASGVVSRSLPGPGDTSCCGSSPAEAGCAGPGSCCGRGPH